jgi:hypothetical protein
MAGARELAGGEEIGARVAEPERRKPDDSRRRQPHRKREKKEENQGPASEGKGVRV